MRGSISITKSAIFGRRSSVAIESSPAGPLTPIGLRASLLRVSERSALRNWLQFLPSYLLLKALGALPRKTTISVSQFLTRILYHLHKRLRQTGHRNLAMALPELSEEQRTAIIKGVFATLGRLLG